MRLIWAAVIALAMLLLSGLATQPMNGQPTRQVVSVTKYPVVVERDVAMKTRDGTILRADIYHPDSAGRFPVLLQRSPYNKLNSVGPALRAAEHGYVVVVQDVRGRYASEGEWYPFIHESDDGFDAVEWVSTLPYSDRRVAMYGGSYLGATVMLAAIAQPPHLVGIFTHLTPSNFYKQWVYQGGAFEQWFNESWLWSSAIGFESLTRAYEPQDNPLQWVWTLPLSSQHPQFDFASVEASATFYQDWLQHPTYDDYWKGIAIDEHYGRINVPIFFVAGWFDTFLQSTLDNYQGIKARGGPVARSQVRLVIGPWLHGPLAEKTGDIDFGRYASLDYDGLMIRWFDHLLKGINNGVEAEKPVKIFVMGKDVWLNQNHWPPKCSFQTFYFHSGGHANSVDGDGTLNTYSPSDEAADRYIYDPNHPVPTLGGGLCCDAHVPGGAFDQRPVESRSDVLVYSTTPFTSDFRVIGPVRVVLYVASSTVDTDFTAKLVDVLPNGYAQNLTDGIIRARYRFSLSAPKPLKPGEIEKITVGLGATGNVFMKGHRLRVEISSSNFPRFDRNLNTGESFELTVGSTPATITVYHNAEYASALILPVISQN